MLDLVGISFLAITAANGKSIPEKKNYADPRNPASDTARTSEMKCELLLKKIAPYLALLPLLFLRFAVPLRTCTRLESNRRQGE